MCQKRKGEPEMGSPCSVWARQTHLHEGETVLGYSAPA